jgi:agmatine deiminase
MRRLPAEWEPQSMVQLTFPHENSDWVEVLDLVIPCFLEIALTISRFQTVLIVCKNIEQTKKLFGNRLQKNILFFEFESNDTWARDHGGITVLEANKPLILDFVFNGWGLKFPADKDNLITGLLHKNEILKAAYQHAGMVLEGGGIESDGKGTLLTTAECLLSLNRNPHLSKKQIENKLKNLFGVQRILWLNHGYLAGDDTDSHIDTLARLCNENTIAYVQCTDKKDEHYKALQKMEKELKKFKKTDGSPYNLIALPMADACFDEEGHRLPATYANFLIINGAVLVPIYKVKQDNLALEILKGVFPKHEVLGIDCSALILQHGSLHCVTMQYPASLLPG